MRRDLSILCPTLLGSLLIGALAVVPGCSLNPQPLPPDSPVDSGSGLITSPGSTTDGGGHRTPDAGKGGGAEPDSGGVAPEPDGGDTATGGDAGEGVDGSVGQGDGGNGSPDGATDAPYDGAHLDAADATSPDAAAPDAGTSPDASQDAHVDAPI